jgi:hypothetical protein
VALLAAAATIASLGLPWITTGLGSEASEYSGLRFSSLALPIAAAALATAVLTTLSVWRGSSFSSLAVVISAIAAFGTAAAIMAIETVAVLIPASLLPKTIERNALSLGAGSGIWLALVGCAVAAIALRGGIPSSILRRARFSGERRRVLALLGLVSLTALIAWLRYRSWVDASAFDQQLQLPAWAAPWIGPLSLIPVWMLIGAVALAGFHSDQIAGLLAAIAGWLTSVLAALVVLAVSSIGRLGLENLLPASTATDAPTFHTTLFVWISFLAGLTVAGLGALLVRFPDRSPGERAAWGC